MNKSAITIAILAALAAAAPASAAAPPDGLAACGAIVDSQARLQCFDRELARSRPPPPNAVPAAPAAPAVATPATPPAPAAAATAAPPAATAGAVATATSPSFGDEQLTTKSRQPESEEARVLHARITSQKEAGSSRIYNVYLDNGQVWRHENTQLGSYLKTGEAVSITKAGLGTYRLTRDAGASKDWIRVTRVR